MIDELPQWFRQAACFGCGPDLFFPDRGLYAEGTNACRVCVEECSVRDKCFIWGLKERHGVWGGMTEKRRKLLKRSMVREHITLDQLKPVAGILWRLSRKELASFNAQSLESLKRDLKGKSSQKA